MIHSLFISRLRFVRLSLVMALLGFAVVCAEGFADESVVPAKSAAPEKSDALVRITIQPVSDSFSTGSLTCVLMVDIQDSAPEPPSSYNVLIQRNMGEGQGRLLPIPPVTDRLRARRLSFSLGMKAYPFSVLLVRRARREASRVVFHADYELALPGFELTRQRVHVINSPPALQDVDVLVAPDPGQSRRPPPQQAASWAWSAVIILLMLIHLVVVALGGLFWVMRRHFPAALCGRFRPGKTQQTGDAIAAEVKGIFLDAGLLMEAADSEPMDGRRPDNSQMEQTQMLDLEDEDADADEDEPENAASDKLMNSMQKTMEKAEALEKEGAETNS
mgnify:CR=1 FL=1